MKIDELTVFKLKWKWHRLKQKLGQEPLQTLNAKNSYFVPQTGLKYFED